QPATEQAEAAKQSETEQRLAARVHERGRHLAVPVVGVVDVGAAEHADRSHLRSVRVLLPWLQRGQGALTLELFTNAKRASPLGAGYCLSGLVALARCGNEDADQVRDLAGSVS